MQLSGYLDENLLELLYFLNPSKKELNFEYGNELHSMSAQNTE